MRSVFVAWVAGSARLASRLPERSVGGHRVIAEENTCVFGHQHLNWRVIGSNDCLQVEAVGNAALLWRRRGPDQLVELDHGSNEAVTLPEAAAIAAPVFDLEDRLRGVLTVVGRARHFDHRPRSQAADALRLAAGTLSRQLGAG